MQHCLQKKSKFPHRRSLPTYPDQQHLHGTQYILGKNTSRSSKLWLVCAQFHLAAPKDVVDLRTSQNVSVAVMANMQRQRCCLSL